MSEPNHAALAALALDLLADLRQIGFGPCPDCGHHVEPDEDCETCNGEGSDRQADVSGGDLVDLIGDYFDDLAEAAGTE